MLQPAEGGLDRGCQRAAENIQRHQHQLIGARVIAQLDTADFPPQQDVVQLPVEVVQHGKACDVQADLQRNDRPGPVLHPAGSPGTDDPEHRRGDDGCDPGRHDHRPVAHVEDPCGDHACQGTGGMSGHAGHLKGQLAHGAEEQDRVLGTKGGQGNGKRQGHDQQGQSAVPEEGRRQGGRDPHQGEQTDTHGEIAEEHAADGVLLQFIDPEGRRSQPDIREKGGEGRDRRCHGHQAEVRRRQQPGEYGRGDELENDSQWLGRNGDEAAARRMRREVLAQVRDREGLFVGFHLTLHGFLSACQALRVGKHAGRMLVLPKNIYASIISTGTRPHPFSKACDELFHRENTCLDE